MERLTLKETTLQIFASNWDLVDFGDDRYVPRGITKVVSDHKTRRSKSESAEFVDVEA